MNRYMPLLIATVLLNAAAQVLMKRGMTTLGRFEYEAAGAARLMWRAALHPPIVLAALLMGLSMGTYLMTLSRMDVSFAMPFMSLGYVLVTVYAVMYLGEPMSLTRLAGIALICLGTLLVART